MRETKEPGVSQVYLDLFPGGKKTPQDAPLESRVRNNLLLGVVQVHPRTSNVRFPAFPYPITFHVVPKESV